MSKFTPGDSGGFEAQAILGEDLGGPLGLLLGAIAIPVPRSWGFSSELSLAGHLVVGLLLVEVLCLVYAYERAHAPLAITLVVLMAAEVMTLVRLARAEPEMRFYETYACRHCGRDFQVELEPWTVEVAAEQKRDLRRTLRVCSSRCAVHGGPAKVA